MLREKSQLLREKEINIKQREVITKINEDALRKKIETLQNLEIHRKVIENNPSSGNKKSPILITEYDYDIEERKENHNINNINIAAFNNIKHDKYTFISDQEKARQESLGRKIVNPSSGLLRSEFRRKMPTKKLKIFVPDENDFVPQPVFFKDKMENSSNSKLNGKSRAISVQHPKKRNFSIALRPLNDITNQIKIF